MGLLEELLQESDLYEFDKELIVQVWNDLLEETRLNEYRDYRRRAEKLQPYLRDARRLVDSYLNKSFEWLAENYERVRYDFCREHLLSTMYNTLLHKVYGLEKDLKDS